MISLKLIIPICCKYKGLKIYYKADATNNDLSVLFVDFSSRYHLNYSLKVQQELFETRSNYSLAKIPSHLSKDKKNHLLFVINLNKTVVVIDYSDLSQITHLITQPIFFKDLDAFYRMFVCYSVLLIQPSDLTFFDSDRFQNMIKICELANSKYETPKVFYLSNNSLIVIKFLNQTNSEVIQISATDQVLHKTVLCQVNNDVVDIVKFWNMHLFFIGENFTSVYNVNNLVAPTMIVDFGKDDSCSFKFVPMGENLVILSQNNFIYFLDLEKKSIQIVRDFYFDNTNSFLKINHQLYLCYDFDQDYAYQITFNYGSLTFEIEPNLEFFHDFNK